jgi:hypothetical protein
MTDLVNQFGQEGVATAGAQLVCGDGRLGEKAIDPMLTAVGPSVFGDPCLPTCHARKWVDELMERVLIQIGKEALAVHALVLTQLEAHIQDAAWFQAAPQSLKCIGQFVPAEMQKAGAGPNAVELVGFCEGGEGEHIYRNTCVVLSAFGQLCRGVKGADFIAQLFECLRITT